MNRILDVIEWVKGPIARTTARRHSFRTIGAALAFGSGQKDAGRTVAYSSERLRVRLQGPVQLIADRLSPPPMGRLARFYVVTVRPMAAWEECDEIRAERARAKADAEKAKEREFYRSQGL